MYVHLDLENMQDSKQMLDNGRDNTATNRDGIHQCIHHILISRSFAALLPFFLMIV